MSIIEGFWFIFFLKEKDKPVYIIFFLAITPEKNLIL